MMITGKRDRKIHESNPNESDDSIIERIRTNMLKQLPILRTYNGAIGMSAKLGVVAIIQSIALFVLILHVANRPITQIVTPPTFTQEISMQGDLVSESYQTAWAMFIADQIGNINAQRADFTKRVIRKMIPARYWREVDTLMTQQLHRLKLKKIEERFVSTAVSYDPRSSLVWVTGEKETTKVRTGKKVSELWTFELKIGAKNGAPQILHLKQYAGKPSARKRTNAVLEKGGTFEKALDVPSSNVSTK
ncbi:hypothetical protein UA32_11700 [Photobacterium angustum]|uniref:Type IV conjugative transfer system protein TraE n=1 Tax=Photobacterium angustum TaxID=661 RepID=A0ABX5H1S9_PHOAN|nr:TraE/TraK family type IV conjugative transfer system protein [Photobacterium angustum]KJG37627.1 hypothetical protein UA32_11700 [Photobacterium angustum]PSX07081.1 hypothetical protein C0W27_16050 [Photobacterium angustum]